MPEKHFSINHNFGLRVNNITSKQRGNFFISRINKMPACKYSHLMTHLLTRMLYSILSRVFLKLTFSIAILASLGAPNCILHQSINCIFAVEIILIVIFCISKKIIWFNLQCNLHLFNCFIYFKDLIGLAMLQIFELLNY